METLNGKLKFDSDGKAYFGNDVEIAGGLTLSGPITWKQNSFPLQSQFSISSSGPWHTDATVADKWRQDKTWNGGWTAPYQFRGEDGRPGSSGSDASVTRNNIVLAMLKATTEDGLYTVDIGGEQCLGINATAIKTGVLDAIDIHGCRITSDSTIDVGTDARVGNSIYLGEYKTGLKKIVFNQTANIRSGAQDDLTISCRELNLEEISNIVWGGNAPIAKFS